MRSSTVIVILIALVPAGVIMHYRRNIEPTITFATPQATLSAVDPAKAMRSLESSSPPIEASKLWADDLPTFALAHSGQWLVGHCSQPCTSPQEASHQAHAAAAEQLDPIIRCRLRIRSSQTAWLHRQMLADVDAGSLQVDELLEKFDRPYGTVWTDSVLLNVSSQQLDPLIKKYRAQITEHDTRTLQLAGVAGMTIALAWCLCFTLDFATRGYFTTRLRVGALVLTLAGIVLLV